MTEIFSNLIQKLPNQERPSHVGEMELIVNFLDPILSPMCHRPNTNKLLIWLNRQDENTLMLKPDAVMMAMPQKTTDITLGYVQVKPKDSLSNPELAFIDLVRLEHNGVTIMSDILEINIPKNITEIGALLRKVDDLKRIPSLYACQIEPKYKNTRPLEDKLSSMMESVNPKRRMKRVPSFSLV
ncbi:hypothetical protein BDC45DRAFT_540098 [Circinella umbellata]|nr:hypothetical protein BDC45DRAFT_540098 [Circinella umbellata]